MRKTITIFAMAFFALVSVKATTPSTWSVVASGNTTEKGEVAWGDFNNDGYLDLIQISNNAFSLYKNNGDETFTNVAATKFPLPLPGGVQQSMVLFMDYNNDGNLDLVISGSNGTTTTTILYKNSGAPNYTFSIDTNNSLIGLRNGNDGDSHKLLSAVDYNNDGWVDLFMEGWCDALNTRIVTLYKNDHGTFVRQTTPVGGTADFEGMSGGSLHTGDVNHDGFVDMISSGYSVTGNYATVLYINNGDGTFTKSPASFTGIEQGEAVLFDSNNDGWLDVFVAGVGNTGSWVWPGTLYLNNQDGTFTAMASGTNLPSGTQGYNNFASGDINNDGKTDLMVMLPNGDNTAIFYNNGDNTFLKDQLPAGARARAGSMDLADFNHDNNLDYFLFGYSDNYSAGWLGSFVKNTSAVSNLAPSVPTNIVATKANGKYTITWDKSTDDITTQEAIRYNVYVKNQFGKIYTYSPADITTGRLKTGSQTLLNKNQIVLELPVGQYTIGVQAVDQSNTASAFGTIKSTTPATWSVVAGGNTTEKGEVAWGDFNNDGYLDLIQISNNAYSLYKNNGDETFTNVASTKFPLPLPGGVQQAMVLFMDYNNDGNLDLVISGSNGTTNTTTLYKNSGAPNYTFTIDTNNSLIGLKTGNDGDSHKGLSAVDYNNDGWIDLFMEGSDNSGKRVTTLYKNVGGTFVRQTTPVGGTADFEQINGGSLHTGDINHDGFVDMICCGYSDANGYVTNLYLNQGDGTFVKSTASFTGVEQGEALLFDSNNDGWLDIYVAGVGHTTDWVWPGTLYLNNQDGTFTAMASGTNLPSGTQSYTGFASGDINNDGENDLMAMLPNGDNTAVYYNNGDNTFLKNQLPAGARARSGSLDLADFNNDNNLDYFVFGYSDGYSSGWLGSFVKNTSALANSAPSIPTNILATKINGKYLITWDKSTDDITPQEALRYNIYVQDQSGKVYAYSPANLTTGRLTTGSQTLLSKNQFVLDLPVGLYTIGVQAVDQSNSASAFITTGISVITKIENIITSKVDVRSINQKIAIQNNGSQNVQISLISLSGQSLYKGLCNAGSGLVIPMTLNQGVYLVKLSQDNKVQTVKVSVL